MLAALLALGGSLGIALNTPPRASRGVAPHHLAHLQNHGYTVIDNFIAPHDVAALVDDVKSLRSDGRFATAGVGADLDDNRLDDSVRRCEQCFVFPKGRQQGAGNGGARERMYSTVDSLQKALNDNAGIPLDSLLTEGLYVYYPNGGYYKRHLDAAVGRATHLFHRHHLPTLSQTSATHADRNDKRHARLELSALSQRGLVRVGRWLPGALHMLLCYIRYICYMRVLALLPFCNSPSPLRLMCSAFSPMAAARWRQRERPRRSWMSSRAPAPW